MGDSTVRRSISAARLHSFLDGGAGARDRGQALFAGQERSAARRRRGRTAWRPRCAGEGFSGAVARCSLHLYAPLALSGRALG